MAEKQVLQEFLATLGFQVNQPSLKSFLNSLGMACKSASKLTAGLVGVAVAAETMVTLFAKNMEKMFYLSQRTKAPVAALRALAFGFGQVGLTSEEALDTIDEFTKRLRYEPGKMALLKALGIDTSEQDPTKLFKDLMLRLREMTKSGAGFVAVQWAEAFGISEKVFNRLMQPGAIEALGHAQKKASGVFKALGVDQQAAAKASREFMNELRELWLIVETVGAKFAIDLMPYVKAFNEALLQFGRDLVQSGLNTALDNALAKMGSFGGALRRVKDAALPVLEALGSALANFTDDFAKFGLSVAIDNALKKMGALGRVMQVFKDVVEILPMVPDVIANLIEEMFGPGENKNLPKQGAATGMPEAPKPGTFAYLGQFAKDWFGAVRTLAFGAQSETFAPKPPWWLALSSPNFRGEGGGATTINHDVDINVVTSDPILAGQTAAAEQRRTEADISRMYSPKNR